jgi:cytochrome P450
MNESSAVTSPPAPAEAEFIHRLRDRAAASCGVYTEEQGVLMVFDPEAARRINGDNWYRYTLPDRVVDLLRRRQSPRVAWQSLRVAWLRQLRALSTPEHTAAMAQTMACIADTRLDRETDLVSLAWDWVYETLVPLALGGLSQREARLVRRDLDRKLQALLTRTKNRRPWRAVTYVTGQLRAGLVVRRVIRQRAAGRRPRWPDLADPIVDMLPELGMDRALGAVTTVTTAIGGPPVAASTCLLYELARQPAWAGRLADELGAVDLTAFHADPTAAAPMTHRFVKEVLRMWSPPLLLARTARRDLEVTGAGRTLHAGDQYLLGGYIIHRSPQYWQDPHVFDPDRWLPGAGNGPCGRGHYVPFGWAPKACIGTDAGTTSLMLICYLMSTHYRLEVPDVANLTMGYQFAAIPDNFTGTIRVRTPLA